MGHQISTLLSGLGRFFEYPVKRKPICFYRQEDFTATGEPHKKVSESQKTPMTDYDKLVDLFYKRLAEQRQYNQEMKEKDRRWSIQKVVNRFPGWNEVTIANLHSLFLLFDNQSNGMLAFDDFSAVLESLGDDNAIDVRKEKFQAADTDGDGWITYDEFLSAGYPTFSIDIRRLLNILHFQKHRDLPVRNSLHLAMLCLSDDPHMSSVYLMEGWLVYNFNQADEGNQLTGLALLCNQVADNIQFVSNLTVGEQLEYGLF